MINEKSGSVPSVISVAKRSQALKKPSARHRAVQASLATGYTGMLSEVSGLLEAARRLSARTVNAVMTATYWEVGRRLVEFEQGGKGRAGYGEQLLERLSTDLTKRFGRGFGMVNLSLMRRFFLAWPENEILQTVSAKSVSGAILQTLSKAGHVGQRRQG